MMLEEATGRDLAHLLRTGVLRPAGMRHSDLPDDPQHRGPFLVEAAYTGEPGTGWRSLAHTDPDIFRAAGAVTSTTADLLSFTDALLTGDLVAPGTVADMTTPRTAESGYGLGVVQVPDPCAPPDAPAYLYGHDGATFGTVSIVLSSPDGSRSVALAVTGRDLSGHPDPFRVFNAAVVPLVLATC